MIPFLHGFKHHCILALNDFSYWQREALPFRMPWTCWVAIEKMFWTANLDRTWLVLELWYFLNCSFLHTTIFPSPKANQVTLETFLLAVKVYEGQPAFIQLYLSRTNSTCPTLLLWDLTWAGHKRQMWLVLNIESTTCYY